MELNKKIIILLTIIGMVVAATAVCATNVHATDNLGYVTGDSGYANDDTLTLNHNSQENSPHLGSGVTDNLNATNTNSTGNLTNVANSTGHAAGSNINATGHAPLNATGNMTNSTNSTGHAAGGMHANATSAANPHHMLATGNPILVLLAVMSVIGVYSIKRK